MSLAVCCSRLLLRSVSPRSLKTFPFQSIRPLSTSIIDPAIRQFVSTLAQYQPYFSMTSTNVHIMNEPPQFYQCLLNMIRRARQKLFISSLYIGSEDLELIHTLHASLRNNLSLHVYMLLDFNRCTRPEPLSTANILLPLLTEFPDRVHVSLFRSPKLKGVMAKLVPPRFNEGLGGTWHPKIYGADDDILISGANLNTSYFTDRQDRYIYFTAQSQLSQYCFTFLEQVTAFSYSLLPSPSNKEEYILHWPDDRTHPQSIEEKAQDALTAFHAAYCAQSLGREVPRPTEEYEKPEGGQTDVLLFPIIQAGQFNIREEERCLALLFDELSKKQPASGPAPTKYNGPLLDLTSGYFGLYNAYQELIIRSQMACRVLAASPKANGFYGSKGVSGRIPEGYTVLERRFMKAVRAAGRDAADNYSSGIQLSEWEKDGWTYHAKGIWLRPTPSASPLLTLFGSTNLNSRSANLDTELSFLLVTSAPRLRQRLAEEVEGLYTHAHAWRGGERNVRLVSWALASALCGFL